MKRQRRLSRWPAEITYADREAFLAVTPQSGMHAVPVGDGVVDILVEDRGADTTLLVFNAALSPRTKLLPAFQGGALAQDCGVNLVSVSDPGCARGDVDLAWYLGDEKTGELPPLLGPMLAHAVRATSPRRTIMMGGSGGGYSAVLYGPWMPDAIVFAINPRLDMQASPKAALESYLTACHPDEEPAAAQRRFVPRRPTDPLDGAPLPFDLCLFQNTGDTRFWNNQFGPFLERSAGDKRVYTRTEYTGEGHTPIPPDTVREIITALARTDLTPAAAIRAAGFRRPAPTTAWDHAKSASGRFLRHTPRLRRAVLSARAAMTGSR